MAAAALVDPDRGVLLTRRHADAHQGGLWEFPGGKLDPGETAQQGLSRELQEELGIKPVSFRPLIQVRHQYGDRTVLLDVFIITDWTGEPEGREGQPLAWADVSALQDYPMPAADVPVVSALQLPDTYLISPPEVTGQRAFLEQLEMALSSGIKLFQFRVFGLDPVAKLGLAREALQICQQFHTRMLINSDLQLLAELPAAGLHLNRRQLSQVDTSIFSDRMMAASCHNLQELQLAHELGMDFAVLSPVLPTQSHPDADVLGWSGAEQLLKEVSLPVFVLGGMTADQLPQSWDIGAQGVAGIRGFWPVK